ncbi:MAG: hypothetical protein N2690_01300 [Rhodocyclaceae bacterium]|nr:hypothetical protein [Rhodocyclaceae bacterium]
MAALAQLAQRAALAVWGEPAQLRPATAPAAVHALRGVFTDAYELMELIGDVGVASVRPALLVRQQDLPLQPQPGDEIEVRARRWRIAQLQPDGYGMLRLLLQEV